MSSDYVSPLSYPDAWDTVEVGGQEWDGDGMVLVSGFKRDFGWDIKKGKGTKGATLTLNEFPPAEGKLLFSLVSDEDFAKWAEFKKQFDYDPPKTTKTAVDIYHPALADLSITSVVCKSFSMIEHQGKGLYQVTVELIEYLPPPPAPAVVTPGFSAGAAQNAKKPGAGDDPVSDALQKQLAGLVAEMKKP